MDRRPQLDAVLEQLRPGDTLVVWRLDRLGRSLRRLIDVVTGLDERGVGFPVVAGEPRHDHGWGAVGVPPVRGLAQFEREVIRDRTVAGLAAAWARGRVGGRPSTLSVEQRRQARKMYDERELPVEQVVQVLGVSRTSIYRALGHTAAPVLPGTPDPTAAVELAAARRPSPAAEHRTARRPVSTPGLAPVGRRRGATGPGEARATTR